MSIVINNIHKSFKDNHVLHGIGFEFETGEVNMIIGASGSGKSVTMKIMVGLLQPDRGFVSYEGQRLHEMTPKQMRELRKQLGMLFQSGALFDSMTLEENVGFPLRMFTKMTAKEKQHRIEEVLEQVELKGNNKLFPAELSGGMKKRAGLARAIVMHPKYLFADEPNSGLDPKTGDVIDELVRTLTYEYNTTTIVITHDIKSVLNIGDKILFIYQGRKAWQGSRDDVRGAENEHLQDFIQTSGLMQQRRAHEGDMDQHLAD
ncbi:MAG: ABC transporter ATP-binding protein [Bacteroidota bacterium]